MMRILPCGESALLVECSADQVAPLHSTLAAAGLPLIDLVPAARTILLRLADATELAAVTARVTVLLAAPLPPPPEPTAERTVTIGVRYDGEDLAAVAELTGLTPSAVIAAHTGRPWRVAFCAFVPGFAYLDGGDPRLVVPRRATPRTAVPAGAVGLADGYSGVYPRSSPGGWQLIGHSEAVLWDLRREPPAPLSPGWWVHFVVEA
ncbi:MAG: 5-oxoprolinase subunit B family protein [Propionicimonas sp.]